MSASYKFLEAELFADLQTSHQVYRAIRAACRLHQEGERNLTERQWSMAWRLELALRQFYEQDSDSANDTLPLLQAKKLLADLRSEKAAGGI